jgi:hypothetical protein
MSDDDKAVITLPILDAFAWLYERNLTIEALWTKREPGQKSTTHITVKPVREPEKPGKSNSP